VVRKSGGLLDPYFIYLARGATVSDYASLYVRVYKKPTSDTSAPSTYLTTKRAAVVAPQIFRFVASGSDLETPTPLCRFSWRVDGGSWSTPSYSRAMTTALTGGKHTVEVRAVDLSGKSDPTPAVSSFDCDAIRPTLVLTPPPAQVTGATASASYVASDDRTPASVDESPDADDPAAGTYEGGCNLAPRIAAEELGLGLLLLAGLLALLNKPRRRCYR